MSSHFRETGLSKVGNAPNDIRLPWKFKSQKCPLCRPTISAPKYQICVLSVLRPVVFEIKGRKSKKSKCTESPQADLQHLTVKSTLYIPSTFPLGPQFCYDLIYSRYKVVEIGKKRKYTEWAQTDLDHLVVDSTFHTLRICHRGPNFAPFHCTTSRFPDNPQFILLRWLPCSMAKKRTQKLPKNQNFTIPKTVLVETLPMSIHELLEVNLSYNFSGDFA